MSNFHQHFMVSSPILADFIFSDCALNPVYVSSNILKTRETCGSSIGNCFWEAMLCHLVDVYCYFRVSAFAKT